MLGIASSAFSSSRYRSRLTLMKSMTLSMSDLREPPAAVALRHARPSFLSFSRCARTFSCAAGISAGRVHHKWIRRWPAPSAGPPRARSTTCRSRMRRCSRYLRARLRDRRSRGRALAAAARRQREQPLERREILPQISAAARVNHHAAAGTTRSPVKMSASRSARTPDDPANGPESGGADNGAAGVNSCRQRSVPRHGYCSSSPGHGILMKTRAG